MEVFSDLHLHSKYSRGCSKNLNFENLAYWGSLKGLNLIGTGDFTHPGWFKEIEDNLEEDGSGFLKLKKKGDEFQKIYFVLSCEISSIFSRKTEIKRIHYLVLFPSLNSVRKFNQKLSLYANLSSDGRPVVGLDIVDVIELVFDIDDLAIFIPAHIWTPWFSLFGSKSGFNSIEEAFGNLKNKVYAIETGLSSDPPMNWRLSQLDEFQIVSFSDAHSFHPHRIGREATVFELEEMNYLNLLKALKKSDEKNYIKLTIEFYPEEGKYHFDGHRECKICLSPKESKESNYICPVCYRKVTIGVMSRVEELADRDETYIPKSRPPFKHLVPLAEIIAKILNTEPTSQKVLQLYLDIVKKVGNEFFILLNDIDLSKFNIQKNIIDAIMKVKKGDVYIKPGFDGEYGVVELYPIEEKYIEEKNELTQRKTLF